MLLLSPIWLVGLFPLAALAVWVLWGRRTRIEVPFLPLWQGPVEGPRAKRSLQPPPIAVTLALLAILLTVVAASRPAMNSARDSRTPLTIVVDRGLRMSGRGHEQLRFREVGRSVSDELVRHFGPATPVRLVVVPGPDPIHSELRSWLSELNRFAPTASDTRGTFGPVVTEELGAAPGPVIAITDQPLVGSDGRLVAVAPETPAEDVAITTLAARDQPAGQVMVRVRNQSGQASAVLVVSTGEHTVQRTIDLPAGGGERDYFIDLPSLGPTVMAQLKVRDDVEANNAAWLVREGSYPRIEPHAALPPELRRLIEAYQTARPATDTSVRVAVVSDIAQLPREEPAVVVAAERKRVPAGVPVQRTDHPIAEHVNWDQLRAPVCVGGTPPEGWSPVVSSGPRVLIAASPDPLRQVWVGFDAPRWATTPDYVIFWTNVFDWMGGGGQRFAGRALAEWAPEWKPTGRLAGQAGAWPGLYRRSDGALRAFNAPDIAIALPPQTDWRARLAALVRRHEGRFDLTPWLLILSAGCLTGSAATWRRRHSLGIPAGQRSVARPAVA